MNRMGSDFAALDAELEALGGEVAGDALALAAAYAPPLPDLAQVDRALSELDGDRPALQVVSTASLASSATADDPASRDEQLAFPRSEEIVLPEPVSREELEAEASREIPLDEPTPRSGSFALPSSSVDAADDDALIDEIDETIELEMEEDEAPQAAPPMFERPRPRDDQAAGSPSRERTRQQFDLEEPRASGDVDADSEFAALFAEATRQSNMPSADDRSGLARLDDSGFNPLDEDTETFDTSVLGFADEPPVTDAIARGDLDAAEFQRGEQAAPGHGATLTSSAPPPRPSQPPEKRPSFLGRLFGRKEDRDGPPS